MDAEVAHAGETVELTIGVADEGGDNVVVGVAIG